jgi:hypothetical protein
MDRRFSNNSLCLVLALAVTGCSASHNFLAHASCNPASDSCTATCGEQAPSCGCTESCEPLVPGTCTADVRAVNGCGCADASGCTGEGCSGTYRKRNGGRHTGLAGGFEHGRKNIMLDGAGWIVGIPSKLLLWNTKVDSHSVSPETEEQLRRYLAAHGMDDVRVRINQYSPVDEWKRLVKNKSIHPGWRYTFGTYSLAKYTLLPGRLFGADEYNPFTNSISLYSDRSSIALREGAHAKQALEANYPGTWAASSYLPFSPAWIDTAAIREVLAYTQETNNRELERETYLVLFPAYGARIGSSATLFLDTSLGTATQAGFAMVGHAVGRTMAFRVSDTPMQMVKSVYGIVKRPEDEPANAETAELQNSMPPGSPFPVKFIAIEVLYDGESDSI